MFILNHCMNISFNPYISSNNYSFSQKSQAGQAQPTFEGVKFIKLIETIKNAKSFKHFNLSFKDIAGIYQELGYDIIFKGGSHAVVPLTETVNLPLVIPHNSKYVSPFELKRLKCILNGEIDKALNIH